MPQVLFLFQEITSVLKRLGNSIKLSLVNATVFVHFIIMLIKYQTERP